MEGYIVVSVFILEKETAAGSKSDYECIKMRESSIYILGDLYNMFIVNLSNCEIIQFQNISKLFRARGLRP